MNPKKSWQERAVETNKFHTTLMRRAMNAGTDHTIRHTAELLRRSYGSVAEDILLASWMLSHPRVAEFKRAYEALKWIREKSREIKLRMG